MRYCGTFDGMKSCSMPCMTYNLSFNMFTLCSLDCGLILAFVKGFCRIGRDNPPSYRIRRRPMIQRWIEVHNVSLGLRNIYNPIVSSKTSVKIQT